jgi:hypothetical protein
LGSRAIAKNLGCGKTVLNNCVKKAARVGLLSWDSIKDLSVVELEKKFYPTREVISVSAIDRYDEPDWTKIELEIRNKNVTLRLACLKPDYYRRYFLLSRVLHRIESNSVPAFKFLEYHLGLQSRIKLSLSCSQKY